MYLSAMCYPVFFYPLHLYVFVLICQYYVVLLERTNKDIIYSQARSALTVSKALPSVLPSFNFLQFRTSGV